MKSIAILGAGAWGTALALHLSRLKQTVYLWTVESDHIPEMIAEKTNRRYLPNFSFPDNLQPVGDLAKAIADVDDILVAVPSVGYRSTLTMLKPLLKKNMRIVSATKGIDLETGQLLHHIAIEILGNDFPFAVLSGPSFAKEVAAGLPTSVMIASRFPTFAKELLTRFDNPFFRIQLSDDLTGLEIGGVVKNVIAVATGINDGLGFGTNARCALITKGLAEMMRLGLAMGCKTETITGLAGLGDLVLTCSDDQSRNRRFGLALGHGKDIAAAEKEIGHVVEGKRNAELVVHLAEKHNVNMPIAETVWSILQGKISAKEGMNKLLTL
jgi:glycerol-3-phosphate dehydrogenase (NAD(P)+)